MTTNTHTPSRKEMIDTIYEKIANKELSFGCRMKFKEKISDFKKGELAIITSAKPVDFIYFSKEGDDIQRMFPKTFSEISEIIGHPVMLGDVVDYCEKYCLEGDIEKLYGVEYMPIGKINLPTNIFTLWEDKRKPITEQSDECVKFVYNLISE